MAYTEYLNCCGQLVYAQTESGQFEEMVRLKPDYYEEGDAIMRRFGFCTLNLSGEFLAFRERMAAFAEKIKKQCIPGDQCQK
jgi:hypothetical protein